LGVRASNPELIRRLPVVRVDHEVCRIDVDRDEPVVVLDCQGLTNAFLIDFLPTAGNFFPTK
jgi:hypothetical protein